MKSNDVTEIEKDWRTHTGSDSADNYLASRKYKLSVGTMYAATPCQMNWWLPGTRYQNV